MSIDSEKLNEQVDELITSFLIDLNIDSKVDVAQVLTMIMTLSCRGLYELTGADITKTVLHELDAKVDRTEEGKDL